MNLGFWGFSQKLFFHNFKWNSGGLGVSRKTAPTVRCYLQSFSRFGGTWGQKVHFTTFSSKLTFQCTRNGPQNLPFCPGLSRTPLLFSSISNHQIFQKDFAKTNLENRQSGNLKIQKPRFTNRIPANVGLRRFMFSKNDPKTRLLLVNLGFWGFSFNWFFHYFEWN